jgi:hypothetical protein
VRTPTRTTLALAAIWFGASCPRPRPRRFVRRQRSRPAFRSSTTRRPCDFNLTNVPAGDESGGSGDEQAPSVEPAAISLSRFSFEIDDVIVGAAEFYSWRKTVLGMTPQPTESIEISWETHEMK